MIPREAYRHPGHGISRSTWVRARQVAGALNLVRSALAGALLVIASVAWLGLAAGGHRVAEVSLPHESLGAAVEIPDPAIETLEKPGQDAEEKADRILVHLERRRSRIAHPDLPALARTIIEESQRHEIDPALVLAVIQVESGCYRRAVSSVGARGLMQVMPSTGAAVARRLALEWEGEDSLFDPQLNVKLGVAYLGELQRRYGDIRKALVAYNWGPTRIDRMLRHGKALPHTYVDVVWSTYESGRESRAGRS